MSSRRYRVEHVTRYGYPDDVGVSYGRAHLLPRTDEGQHVVHSAVHVDPVPAEQRDHVDFFGNRSTFYLVREPHRELRVSAVSEVVVERAPAALDRLDATAWETLRPVTDADALGFTVASPAVPWTEAVRAYASQSFTPGRGAGSLLRELSARIHADFAYVSGATSISSTLTDLLQRRRGVCQDFAHLLVGCLRSHGLPARYVSGYLETDPPAGTARLQGADASHAWAGLLVPGHGWVDVDPTNDQVVDDRYVVAAYGRDYGDVPPLKGVVLTDAASSTMEVAVDVVRIG